MKICNFLKQNDIHFKIKNKLTRELDSLAQLHERMRYFYQTSVRTNKEERKESVDHQEL